MVPWAKFTAFNHFFKKSFLTVASSRRPTIKNTASQYPPLFFSCLFWHLARRVTTVSDNITVTITTGHAEEVLFATETTKAFRVKLRWAGTISWKSSIIIPTKYRGIVHTRLKQLLLYYHCRVTAGTSQHHDIYSVNNVDLQPNQSLKQGQTRKQNHKPHSAGPVDKD